MARNLGPVTHNGTLEGNNEIDLEALVSKLGFGKDWMRELITH